MYLNFWRQNYDLLNFRYFSRLIKFGNHQKKSQISFYCCCLQCPRICSMSVSFKNWFLQSSLCSPSPGSLGQGQCRDSALQKYLSLSKVRKIQKIRKPTVNRNQTCSRYSQKKGSSYHKKMGLKYYKCHFYMTLDTFCIHIHHICKCISAVFCL